MLDVTNIMKDLATIVHQQGDTIGETCVCDLHITMMLLF